MATKRRKAIPKAVRESVAARQQFRCANQPGPGAAAVGCKRYTCPLWALALALAQEGGTFDEAGYEIDHIVEVSHGGADDADNLQALCPCCHRVKTRRFRTNKNMFPSPDLHQGRCLMECDEPRQRRKKRKATD